MAEEAPTCERYDILRPPGGLWLSCMRNQASAPVYVVLFAGRLVCLQFYRRADTSLGMTEPAYGSLAQNARSKNLKTAKIILWFVGILNILMGGFQFANVEKEVDDAIGTELRKAGLSYATADQEKLREVRTDTIGKAKLIYGASIGLGVLFVGCALIVNRAPVVATVSGLVLFLGATAAIGLAEPSLLLQGIIMRVAIIIGLISAVKSALAVEKDRRAELSPGGLGT